MADNNEFVESLNEVEEETTKKEKFEMSLGSFKRAFQDVFCGGGNACDDYPCMCNILSKKYQNKVTIEDLIISCPHFYNEEGNPRVNLKKLGKIRFI